MRRPDRARTTKNFKRQLEISLIPSPSQSKTTTPDISQSTGTKLSLLIVIFITTHVRSKRQFTYTLITSIETVGLKIPEAWMLATTDRQGHKSAKQRGNAPDYTPDS